MALNIAEGIVERVGSKMVNTKHGEKLAYSAKVAGEWYSVGFKAPSFGEGDTIQFTYKLNGNYKNADTDNLEVLKKAEPEVSTSSTGGSSSSSGDHGKTGYWDAKDQRDIETNVRLDIVGARNSAIAYVTAALNAGALSLGTKKEAKEKLFKGYVDQMTNEFLLHPINQERIGANKPEQEEVEEEEAINPALEED